jgi:hydrogenase nickel incorporation protein HypA/HybF
MHEMTIANAILAETLVAVTSHDEVGEGACVEQVDVAIGQLQLVVGEALQMAWDAVCEGTAAEGAMLATTTTSPQAECRRCGDVFAPKIDDYLCPACGVADVEILAGNDIVLTSVVCRTQEG